MGAISGLKGQKLALSDEIQAVIDLISSRDVSVSLIPSGFVARRSRPARPPETEEMLGPELVVGAIEALEEMRSGPDRLVIALGAPEEISRKGREPAIEGRPALNEWARSWLAGRVYWDDGRDLAAVRVCVVSVPVLCRECATEFRAVLYIVPRLSDARPVLQDMAIWVGSGLFGRDVFGRLESVIAAGVCGDGRRLGPVVEPRQGNRPLPAWWTRSRQLDWSGPRRWSVCPDCGAPAPGHDRSGHEPALALAARDAARAPLQEIHGVAACESLPGWTYPGWRMVAPESGNRRHDVSAWRKIVREVAGPVWLESKRILEIGRGSVTEEGKIASIDPEKKRDMARRRAGIVRAAAFSLFGPHYEDRDAIIDKWMDRKLEDWVHSGSPREIAEWSPEGCRRLRMRLEEMARILREGGEGGRLALRRQIENDPGSGLGLPMADLLSRAIQRQ